MKNGLWGNMEEVWVVSDKDLDWGSGIGNMIAQ